MLTGAGEVVVADPEGRARRPVPGVPQLLRHARLRAAAGDRPGAGPAVRPRCGTCGSTTWPTLAAAIGEIVASGQLGRRAGGLPRRHRVHRQTRPTSPSGPGPTVRRTPRTTPDSRSTTGRSSSGASDYLTVRDYLWRWDTDWFWCSRAFGAQNPRIRRLWPKRWLRSDVYWKLIRAGEPLPRRGPAGAARRGLPPRERRGAGRRDPARPHRRLPATGSCARCRSSRSGCARSGCAPTGPAGTPAAGEDALAALPAGGRARPTSTSASGRPSPIQPGRADGDVNRRRSRGWWPSTAATSPSTPTPTTTRTSSGRSTAARTTRRSKKRYDPDGRLLDLYAKAVKRR